MDSESTRHCGSGITWVNVLSASVPLFTACGTAPGKSIGRTLRNALHICDQVYVDLTHYEDSAVALAGSTDAMCTLSQCLHESIATSSLFDVDRDLRHVKPTYRLLEQANVAANGQQEIAMPAFGAEARQA